MHLKGRSHAIKIHDGDDEILSRTRTGVLFEFGKDRR